MDSEIKKPKQEGGVSNFEETTEVEQSFNHEEVILEAEYLSKAMIKQCEEMTARLEAEGEDVGVSKEDIEYFQDQIKKTYDKLTKIVVDYGNDIKKDESQMKLAESLNLETLNVVEIANKIEGKKGKKKQIEQFIEDSKDSYSKLRNTKERKEKIEREKETNRQGAKAEIEQIIAGVIRGEKYGEGSCSFKDLQSKETSIYSLNERTYSLLRNMLLDTQPGIVKEVVDQKLKENPELEEEFKKNREKIDLTGLSKEQKMEIEEKLIQKEEKEKSQQLFDADSFLKLVREGKVDVEKLCESVAGGIKILDADYLNNARVNKNDVIFLPSMVLEKIFENMKDEEIFEIIGREAENINNLFKTPDWNNSGFNKYQDYKTKSDLYFNLRNHPEFSKRITEMIDRDGVQFWKKEKEYITNHFGSEVADFSKQLENVKNNRVANTLIDKKENALEEVDIREKIKSIEVNLQKISEKRENLMKRLEEEKSKIDEYTKKYDIAIRKEQFSVALEILDKVENMGKEVLSANLLKEELEKLDKEEKNQKELLKQSRTSFSVDEVGSSWNEFDRWDHEKELEKKMEKGFSSLAVEITKKAKIFYQKTANSEMRNKEYLQEKKMENERWETKKQIEEMSGMASRNDSSRYSMLENNVYTTAVEVMKKEISLPDIKWLWGNLRKITDNIYKKEFKEEHEEGIRLKEWLEDKKNSPTEFGLFGVKINNPLENNKESRFKKDSLNNLKKQVQDRFNEISKNLERKRKEVKKMVFAEMKDHYDSLISELQNSKQKREKFLSQFSDTDSVRTIKNREEIYTNSRKLIKDKFVEKASDSNQYNRDETIYGIKRIDKWLDSSTGKLDSDKFVQEDFEQQWEENIRGLYDVLVKDSFKKIN